MGQFINIFSIKELVTMADKKEILRTLKSHLQKNHHNSVKDVILFGSQASKKIIEESDYDILIILADNYSRKDEDKILDLCYDIDLMYNILIDAHIISVTELSSLRGKQPIFVNAINSGIYA